MIPSVAASERGRSQTSLRAVSYTHLCPQALQEALLANRSAYYFFQLLDAEQRERIIRYAEQGAEEQRIRRIDKIIAMLYERRTL